MRRVVLFSAVLLTALTTGLEFAHVLEWPQKQHYAGPLYVRLQESLYVWFGNLGGVLYVLTVIATVALAVLARRDPGRRGVIAAAASLQVVGLVTFLTIIYPVNLRLPGRQCRCRARRLDGAARPVGAGPHDRLRPVRTVVRGAHRAAGAPHRLTSR